MLAAVEDFNGGSSGGSEGVTIDDSARNTFTPPEAGEGSLIPVNCTANEEGECGIVEWHPHFTSWFGVFEPSETRGSLSVSQYVSMLYSDE